MSEGVCQKSGSLACAAGSDGQGGEIVERGGVVNFTADAKNTGEKVNGAVKAERSMTAPLLVMFKSSGFNNYCRCSNSCSMNPSSLDRKCSIRFHMRKTC